MRITYDNSAYQEVKSRPPKSDGKHCVICGKDLPKGQRKYCGSECWGDWFSKVPHPISWAQIRLAVIQRDNYTCQKCSNHNLHEAEVDHIVPVSMGGDNFDLENLQTLCHECHARKTAEDMTRLRESQASPNVLGDFYRLIESMEKNLCRWENGLLKESSDNWLDFMPDLHNARRRLDYGRNSPQ